MMDNKKLGIRLYVSPNFYRKIKVEAAEKGLGTIDYTETLAEKPLMEQLKDAARKNKKLFPDY